MGIISDTDVNVRLGTTDALNELYYTGLGSAKLASDNKIKYYLKNIPTGIININIFNQVDEVLEDFNYSTIKWDRGICINPCSTNSILMISL